MIARRALLSGVGGLLIGTQARAAPTRSWSRPFRILSIDGGGYKGVIPARILERLDTQLTPKGGLVACFDLFAGTSTGAIIAAGLAAQGLQAVSADGAAGILNLYRTRGREIFDPSTSLPERMRESPFDWWGSKYSSKGISKVLSDSFGTLKIGQFQRNFLCTYYRFTSEKSEAVFVRGGPGYRSIDEIKHADDLVWADILYSTTAPTYFNPATSSDGGDFRYVDGGLFANNPALYAYLDATRIVEKNWPGRPIEIVSLGCGKAQFSMPRSSTWGRVEWLQPRGSMSIPLLVAVLDSQDGAINSMLRTRLSSDRYFRLQPTIRVVDGTLVGDMDDVSSKNFKAMWTLADDYYNHDPELARLIASIEKDT